MKPRHQNWKTKTLNNALRTAHKVVRSLTRDVRKRNYGKTPQECFSARARGFAALDYAWHGRFMSGRASSRFALPLESLRSLGRWAADCAERALPVYERHVASDSRPRAAIDGIRVFAGGGERTAQLRTLALSAFSAARMADDPAAAAAARAAGLAAASAYTHPLADIHQTKHIVGPAAYAALALELDRAGDVHVGEREVRRAIEHVPSAVRDVLLQMPSRRTGGSRLQMLLYELDAGIRRRMRPQDAEHWDLPPMRNASRRMADAGRKAT